MLLGILIAITFMFWILAFVNEEMIEKREKEAKRRMNIQYLSEFSPFMSHAFSKLLDKDFMKEKDAKIQEMIETGRKITLEGRKNSQLPPVMIIPGLLGSKIFLKLNKTVSEHNWCYLKTSDYFLSWVDVLGFVPYRLACTYENLFA